MLESKEKEQMRRLNNLSNKRCAVCKKRMTYMRLGRLAKGRIKTCSKRCAITYLEIYRKRGNKPFTWNQQISIKGGVK